MGAASHRALLTPPMSTGDQVAAGCDACSTSTTSFPTQCKVAWSAKLEPPLSTVSGLSGLTTGMVRGA